MFFYVLCMNERSSGWSVQTSTTSKEEYERDYVQLVNFGAEQSELYTHKRAIDFESMADYVEFEQLLNEGIGI